jgi:hypothetical protein
MEGMLLPQREKMFTEQNQKGMVCGEPQGSERMGAVILGIVSKSSLSNCLAVNCVAVHQSVRDPFVYLAASPSSILVSDWGIPLFPPTSML